LPGSDSIHLEERKVSQQNFEEKRVKSKSAEEEKISPNKNKSNAQKDTRYRCLVANDDPFQLMATCYNLKALNVHVLI
jgi:hypothetical protein